MMTRKDYVETATILRTAIEDAFEYHTDDPQTGYFCAESIQFVAEMFAEYFAKDNPNFDEDRFFEAVHTHVEKVSA
jgi:hypothetical protein